MNLFTFCDLLLGGAVKLEQEVQTTLSTSYYWTYNCSNYDCDSSEHSSACFLIYPL